MPKLTDIIKSKVT